MDRITHRARNRSGLPAIYVGSLLLAFHWYIIAYVHSSFLALFFSNSTIGILYSVGALLNLILLLLAPRILKRTGNYRFIIYFLCLELFAIAAMALGREPFIIALGFIAHGFSAPMILFSLDVSVENYTPDDRKTGGIRGLYLTLGNIALVISPAIVALTIKGSDFSRIYLLSIFFLLPLFYVVTKHFKKLIDRHQVHIKIKETTGIFLRNKNLFNVFMARFVLQFFYAWMVIYMPVYLFKNLGMPWSTIGFIFTIMLLPFIIFELPLGSLADRRLGEKEILILGFVIMGASTLLIPLVQSQEAFLWASLLFITRVGASFVEISTESFFFKHVDGHDANLIGFFRLNSPLAYIIAPLLASIILFYTGLSSLFLILGIFVFSGIFFSLRIKDTR